MAVADRGGVLAALRPLGDAGAVQKRRDLELDPPERQGAGGGRAHGRLVLGGEVVVEDDDGVAPPGRRVEVAVQPLQHGDEVGVHPLPARQEVDDAVLPPVRGPGCQRLAGARAGLPGPVGVGVEEGVLDGHGHLARHAGVVVGLAREGAEAALLHLLEEVEGRVHVLVVQLDQELPHGERRAHGEERREGLPLRALHVHLEHVDEFVPQLPHHAVEAPRLREDARRPVRARQRLLVEVERRARHVRRGRGQPRDGRVEGEDLAARAVHQLLLEGRVVVDPKGVHDAGALPPGGALPEGLQAAHPLAPVPHAAHALHAAAHVVGREPVPDVDGAPGVEGPDGAEVVVDQAQLVLAPLPPAPVDLLLERGCRFFEKRWLWLLLIIGGVNNLGTGFIYLFVDDYVDSETKQITTLTVRVDQRRERGGRGGGGGGAPGADQQIDFLEGRRAQHALYLFNI